MNRVIGGHTYRIETDQDKKFLKLVVSEFEDSLKSHDVVFSNSDDSKIEIDFSYLDISITFDPDDDSVSFGEFEYVKPFKNGFEIFGDFGIIWVYCDSCSLPDNQYS